MLLKYTDLKWATFRVTAEYGRLLRATTVTTRYVFSTGPREVLAASEYTYFLFRAPAYEVLGSSDRIRLSYSAGVSDSVAVPEVFAVSATFPFADARSAVDVARVTVRSPFRDAPVSLDTVRCNYVLRVSDVVGLNEFFFFGGLFRYNAVNVAFAGDKIAGNFRAGKPEVAAVSEFIRVGLRHMVDFYLGGFTLGGVAFGGRVR